MTKDLEKDAISQFIKDGYAFQRQAADKCVQLLAEISPDNMSVSFDKRGFCAIVPGVCFADGTENAYIVRLYSNGGELFADLYAREIGETMYDVQLSDETDVDYLGILDILNRMR